MPFYLMPTLGGNDTLRGFREYRFRGPHAILRRREYRWEIWSGLDGALFYDAGKVANRRADLEFQGSRDRLRLRVPLQHRQRHHPPRGCRRSGAGMANTCTSSSAASSKMARAHRRLGARAGSSACSPRAAVALPRSAAPRFYPDDPLWTDDDRAIDASKAGSIEDSNGYDFVVNTFGQPGERRDVRALNVNTVDEVPDSSWFTNRIGRKALSAAEIAKGPDRSAGVSLEGWMVSGGKSAGVQPGFRMTDPEGQLYQIEVDPPSNPELASGAEIIGTAFYHAIGYHVVDVYLAEIDREALVISDKATIRDPLNGRRRRLKKYDLDNVFDRAARLDERPLPRARQPLRAGQAARQLPLLRHAPRRSERHRCPRASARAARRAGLRRLAQSRRLARHQQPRHARDDRRARLGQALHVRLRIDPRQRHRLRAAPSAGQRIHLRAEAGLADAGHARPLRAAVDDHRLSRRAADRSDVSRPNASIRSSGSRSIPTRRSTTCGRTMRSGRRGSCRSSPTRRFARSSRRPRTAIRRRPTT